MALTYEEKIAIAKLKAEGLSAYAIFRQLGIQKDKVYSALKSDEELRILIEDFSKVSEYNKKNAAENAKQELKRLYEEHGKELVDKFYELIAVPPELVKSSSLRDRMGAGKLMLEMIENIACIADEEQIADECAATIEVVVEDASGGD